MGRRFFKVLAVLASLFTFAAAPAFGETQVVDATLPLAISMTGDPTALSNGWVLETSGPSNHSGGSMTIQANVPYSVTLVSDKATLSEWDGTGYVSGGKALALPLSVSATKTGGGPLAVGLTSTATLVPGVLATNIAGGATDSYDLMLTQTTTIADSPLTVGNTYHSVLTYTAASTLP